MTKRVMHGRAVDTAFAKAFNLLGKMGPRELRDKMEEMGYKPGTGLFKELLKSRGKSKFKDGGLAEAIEKVKAKEMQSGGEALSSPKFGAKSGGKSIDINTPTGRRKISEIRKILPGASRDEIIEFGVNAGVLKKEKGGEVPAKFKGFSKLPEAVQEKMNPTLAKKFGDGGSVKGKGSKMMCRGRGAAIKGGGFSIR